jgi:hypothetical protein
MVSPAVAATPSLQLRTMSNAGTRSAMATTSCELRAIIEIKEAICTPARIFLRSPANVWNHFNLRKPTGAGDVSRKQLVSRGGPFGGYPPLREPPIAFSMAANKELSCKGFSRKATRPASS